MKRFLVPVGVLALLSACQSGAVAQKSNETKPTAIRLYSIGHSLSSEIPDMVSSLAKGTPGLQHSFQEQFRLGASLQMQWEEAKSPRDQYDDKQYRVIYPKSLANGGFNAVVLIDSVPRGGKQQEAQSVEYLTKFVQYIDKTNPKAEIYYCEAWHSLLSGTGKAQWDTISPTRNLEWRKRIDADAPMWEGIRKTTEKATGKKITLIPQAQAVGRLVDAINAGKVPGFKKSEEIFGDDIHLNPYGMYFVACLHYAVMYGRSPEGLTVDLKDRWNRPYWGRPFYNGKTYTRPNEAGVKEMQKLAWQVATGK